jgi:tyrosyl-tRNA synthetase
MLAGVDLIRRKKKQDAYCATCTLLLNSEGKKMGKTQKGALWLDENKCSVYDFYQYFRNVEDCKVAECMRLLTFMDMAEIEELTRYQDERINAAKERLAYEVTKLVHGEEKANIARSQAQAAFAGSGAQLPTSEVTGVSTVVDAMVAAGIAKSKGEARRLIEQGGVSVDENKVTDANAPIPAAEFVLHKGKKVHVKIIVK